MEQAYLDLLQEILDNGEWQDNRTGIRTKGIFGAQLRFDLSGGDFPLLTTKRVSLRLIAEELFWFIKGGTNAGSLIEKNVRIWDEWTPAYKRGGAAEVQRCYDQNNQHYDLELGPVYGHQWRAFGERTDVADFHDEIEGVDQLKNVIERIKTNPSCRRLIVSAWNPQDIPNMALPPCHAFFQFRVMGEKLHMQMYQRSADMFLGVPFNIASYALLQIMVAKVCDLIPGDFIHTFGDAHIYENHMDQVKEQLSRKPLVPPKLGFNRPLTDIFDITYEDIKLLGYVSHSAIKGEVAV